MIDQLEDKGLLYELNQLRNFPLILISNDQEKLAVMGPQSC